MGRPKNPKVTEAVAWMLANGETAAVAAKKFEVTHVSVQRAAFKARSRLRKGEPEKQAEKPKKAKVEEARAPAQPPRPHPARARVDLDDEVREGLQRGARQAVAAIADDVFMRSDPQGWANICRGLDAVIRFAPDAVAMRQKLAPPSASGDAAAADLAEAMGVDPKAPATVTVLAGGKQTTG